MCAQMTREQGSQYRRRWETVREAERAELQSASGAHKLRQLAALMASVEAMGWSEPLAAEESVVRERWVRLRRAYRG